MAAVVLHKDVDVTPQPLFIARVGAENPSPHYGLGLEIVGNLLIHLGTHKRFN
jgi:hypothetical protein